MGGSEGPKFPDGWGRMPEGMIGSVEQAIADAAEAKGYKAGLDRAAKLAERWAEIGWEDVPGLAKRLRAEAGALAEKE